MTAEVLMFFIFVRICYTDIFYRKIENGVLVLLLITLFLFGLINLNSQLLVSLAFLVIGGIFLKGIIAPGDIKLVAVILAATDINYVLLFFVMTLFIGGVLAIVYLIKNRFVDSSAKNNGLPYGVPISISGFLLLVTSL
ncbi:prepilin peptidase [Vibrio tapetis]|uniref:Prepilin type IV endopeptidase peptidase domain-containing protein n=1 Tax=Vibrio tapetis subsp. tapetis TaxID=1671868 RepID=A0A2N8ZC84_9VIBR|nr:prepilin peptidase [Vibrio tapetis]SON49517.1 conserved membrane protein of unknown function [Vibrio tapetis subsp. tapetis]